MCSFIVGDARQQSMLLLVADIILASAAFSNRLKPCNKTIAQEASHVLFTQMLKQQTLNKRTRLYNA